MGYDERQDEINQIYRRKQAYLTGSTGAREFGERAFEDVERLLELIANDERLEELKAENEGLVERLDRVERERDDLDAECADMRCEIEELEISIKMFRRRVEDLESHQDSKRLNTCIAALDSSQKLNGKLLEKIEELEGRNRALSIDLKQANANSDVNATFIADLAARNQWLEKELESRPKRRTKKQPTIKTEQT